MKKIVLGILIFSFILTPSLCLSEETITGHYCYTYGDRESLQESRELVRTLSIRNGIESYRVFIESTGRVSNFTLTNDLIQTISSGYLKNIKVLEHTEQGKTICEKISGTVVPEEVEKVMRQEIERRTKQVEDTGVDNNGFVKILRVYNTEEVEPSIQLFGSNKIYTYVNVVCTTMSDMDCDKIIQDKNNIFITFYDSSGNPLRTYRKLFCGGSYRVYKNEIQNITFVKPPESSHYKVWLHK